MSHQSVVLGCDAAPLIAALSAASALADRSLEVCEGLLGLLDLPQKLVSVECDFSSAATTGEVIVRLHPSDRLRILLAARGAGNV